MTVLTGLPFFPRSLLSLWALLNCLASVTGVVYSASVRRVRYALPALVSFLASFFIWQVLFLLSHSGTNSICRHMEKITWCPVVLSLLVLSLAAAFSVICCVRRSKTAITPFNIKYCADRMDCGICYWWDNGHVIFSNDRMDQLAGELTGAPLMNGNSFREAVPGRMCASGGRTWYFTSRNLSYDGGVLHELIARDVTELNRKTEALRAENAELSRLRQQLREYSLRIDDFVREQEVLQAKVNIHDEMNRLMLTSVATKAEDAEVLDRVFAQWEKNALLLCREADEKSERQATEQLCLSLGMKLE